MVLVLSRLFLLLLVFADWAGDPYFGHSPLSRPFASQDAYCHSLPIRTTLFRAITPSGRDLPFYDASSCLCATQSSCPPARKWEVMHMLLPAMDPIYALMSLQC
jgi:hypothetical protein